MCALIWLWFDTGLVVCRYLYEEFIFAIRFCKEIAGINVIQQPVIEKASYNSCHTILIFVDGTQGDCLHFTQQLISMSNSTYVNRLSNFDKHMFHLF